MDKDIRISYAEFNESAMRIYFSLFREFRTETEAIERNGSENVFQLLRAKYVSTLRQKLEGSANAMLDQCKSADAQGRLRIGFSEKIKYFIKEFTIKSSAL